MLTLNPAKEIRGTFALPPNPDLLYPALCIALRTRAAVQVPHLPRTPLLEHTCAVFAPAFDCSWEEQTLVCRPREQLPEQLELPEGAVFCRDFVVLSLLAAGVAVRFAALNPERIERWRELVRRFRCTLTATVEEPAAVLRLEGSPDAGVPAEGVSPDELHAMIGLSFGMGGRMETTVDFQPHTVLRPLFAAFGVPFEVRSAAQRPDDRIARRILRMKGKTLAGSSASTFAVSGDFHAEPLSEVVLELPGDDVLGALLLTAKTLIPRGNLVVENMPLEPWATAALQFLRRMGANPAIQPNRQSCGGECGMVQMQRFDAAGRKLECVPVCQHEMQLPAMMVVAMFAEGESVVRSVEQLRHDLPDTMATLVGFLEQLGCHHGAMPDGLVVRGASQYDGFDAAADLPAHIAGAWSMAALKCMGTSTVADGPLSARWPGFGAMLQSICEFRT